MTVTRYNGSGETGGYGKAEMEISGETEAQKKEKKREQSQGFWCSEGYFWEYNKL